MRSSPPQRLPGFNARRPSAARSSFTTRVAAFPGWSAALEIYRGRFNANFTSSASQELTALGLGPGID